MAETNWKSKYQEMKAKFMESVDVAFRIGYEQGAQEAQMQAMQQAQQQQEEASQQGAIDGEGQPDQQVDEQGNEAPQSANPQGSELDQHIAELESMLGKGEVDMTSLLKSVETLRKVQKDIALQNELKKSAEAIPHIAKALHKPKFKIGRQATHNMTKVSKEAVNMQEKIVSDIMMKWEEEEKTAKKDITNLLSVEGIVKK